MPAPEPQKLPSPNLTRLFEKLAKGQATPIKAVTDLLTFWTEGSGPFPDNRPFFAALALTEAVFKKQPLKSLPLYSFIAGRLRQEIAKGYPVEGQEVKPSRVSADDLGQAHLNFVKSAMQSSVKLEKLGQLESAHWLVYYAVHTTDGCERPASELAQREHALALKAQQRMQEVAIKFI